MSFLEVTRRLRSCEANDEKSRTVSLQYVYSEHTYTRVSERLIFPRSASEFLRLCAVVAKLTKPRKQYVCCIHNVHDVVGSDFLEWASLV